MQETENGGMHALSLTTLERIRRPEALERSFPPADISRIAQASTNQTARERRNISCRFFPSFSEGFTTTAIIDPSKIKKA